MNVKKQILIRIYIVYILIVAIGVAVVWKIIRIQFVEGEKWIALEQKLHQGKKKINADRGTIYSADGNMLSVSLPFYDLYLDFNVQHVRVGRGVHFYKHIDSLALQLANLFYDKSEQDYKQLLLHIYKNKRVAIFKKNVSYEQKKTIQTFPLVREGRYKSGFQFIEKNKRRYPYGLLAKRTLGFARDTIILNVGLESTYDKFLRGASGYQHIRYIAGGVYAPVDGYNIEPENGKDVMTTIDTRVQDITELALLKMLKKNDAEWGTAVVMDVKTGQIKAIANLGKSADDTSYYEKINYALYPFEPGSTFKLVTLLALFEDGYAKPDEEVSLYGGVYEYAKGAVMKDSEKHGLKKSTVREAFARSSNVGISLLAYTAYKNNPEKFFAHFKKLHIGEKTGIDLAGERVGRYKQTSDKTWITQISLPWMSIGYELEITPMKMLMIYNAIANHGTMMRPYLVSDIYDDGKLLEHISPEVVEARVCGEKTTRELCNLLLAVTREGTSKRIFRNSKYSVAGKTGTSLFYGTQGYKDSVHQASFVGFFPAEKPLYSCIVVIKNKAKAKNYYGTSVAAPVFKEISDKLYALYHVSNTIKKELRYVRHKENLQQVQASDFTFLSNAQVSAASSTLVSVPQLIGRNKLDIVRAMEKYKLRIIAIGSGNKVRSQSVPSGTMVSAGTTIRVQL